jgi:hypothetical protein
MSLQISKLDEGVSLVESAHYKYLYSKVKSIADGATIDSKMVLEITLQSMIIMSKWGNNQVSGSEKKSLVLSVVRNFVTNTDSSKLESSSKMMLLLLLEDDGLVSATIDNFVYVTTQKFNFSGVFARCGCLPIKKSLKGPDDFNPK